ncbi:MAG: PD-(D/E)XK motif protein [Euryarchaeota archaeon]
MEFEPHIIQTQFEVSEAQFQNSGRESYRRLNENIEVLLGHDSGFDHIAFQVVMGHSSWVERTSSLDVRSTSIIGLGESWESGAYIIRYPSENREDMRQFVIDIIHLTDYQNPIESTELIIERWIQIWRNREPLGREQQMGLFGELSVLEKLLVAGNDDAVENWTGPERATHDFEFASRHIEVKTTGTSEPILDISSFNQLRPCNPTLYLVMVQMEIESGETLPGLIANVRDLLNPNSQELFERKLELARYNDDHAIRYQTEYGTPIFSVVQINSTIDVLHEDRLDNPVRGLVDLQWSLDASTLPFEGIDDNFWLDYS